MTRLGSNKFLASLFFCTLAVKGFRSSNQFQWSYFSCVGLIKRYTSSFSWFRRWLVVSLWSFSEMLLKFSLNMFLSRMIDLPIILNDSFCPFIYLFIHLSFIYRSIDSNHKMLKGNIFFNLRSPYRELHLCLLRCARRRSAAADRRACRANAGLPIRPHCSWAPHGQWCRMSRFWNEWSSLEGKELYGYNLKWWSESTFWASFVFFNITGRPFEVPKIFCATTSTSKS